MNREIKFKAWDNIDKKMYHYALQGFNGEIHAAKNNPHNGEWKNIGCGREDGEVDYDVEMLQFTGLKDKNGKEIYEGDIVKTWAFGEGQVFYWNEMMAFAYCDPANPKLRMNWVLLRNPPETYKLEVIGNIYENPELLKK